MRGLPPHRVVVVVVEILLGGCETSVDPVTGTEKAYTVYGVLDPTRSEQSIQVFPIASRLMPYTLSDTIEAEVTSGSFSSSGDLEGGSRRRWDGSTRLIDDRVRYVFSPPFCVEYGTRYQLRIEGPRGATTVEVQVPQEARLEVQPADTVGTVTVPVRVTAPVPNLINVRVRYYVKFSPRQLKYSSDTLTYVYDSAPRRTENGWIVPIHLRRDFDRMFDRYRRRGVWGPYPDPWGVQVIKMWLHLTVANELWEPPQSGFDRELLVQPGTMSNVENGFGFVGTGYRLSKEWRPESRVLELAGFRPF